FGNTGVKEFLSTIDKEPVRFPARDVIARCVGCNQVECSPIRINPRVQFHTPLMGFVDRKLQWVIKRRRRLPRLAGQETAPRLAAFGIKRIGGGPYLQKYRIDARTLVVVQVPDEFFLLLSRT